MSVQIRALRAGIDGYDLAFRLAIMVLPAVLVAVNDSWIFSKPLTVDRWIYSGLHLHLPEFLKAFGHTYYASRVPWTVSGWLLHSAFDDATALYVLHFAVFYLAVFSLYAAVRTVFRNTAAAGVTALIFGSHSFFLIAVGWDYVDGPSIACSLASIAAAASTAVGTRWRLGAVVWGVAACAMVSIYFLLILLLPVQIGLFLLLNKVRGKHPLVEVAMWLVAGGIAAMVLFGLVNWLLGGPFYYILNQINALSSVANNRSRYDTEFLAWVGSAHWLLVPLIAFAFSCAYVALQFRSAFENIRRGDFPASREFLLFIVCLTDMAASLIFGILQADRFYVLQFDYNADALLPFAYLAIGGALAAVIPPSGRPRQYAVLIIAAILVILPWVLAEFRVIFPRWNLFNGAFALGWIFAASILLLSVVERSYRLIGAALLVLVLSIVNLGAPSQEMSYPAEPILKSETLAIFDASREIARYNRNARARFWYDGDDPAARDLRAVVITYFWKYSLINAEFPRLVDRDGRQSVVAPKERIILMTSGTNDPIPMANGAVIDQNLLFTRVAKIEIHRPPVGFTIFVADVEIDESKYEQIPAARAIFGRAVGSGLVGSPGNDSVRFRTPERPWAYGAVFPVMEQDFIGPIWIRVRVDVQGGPLGVGILAPDGRSFLDRTVLSVSGYGTADLLLPKPQAIGSLIFQSWDEGKPADVRVISITAFRPRLPAAKG